MPGIGEVIDGAMQHAPQALRQSMEGGVRVIPVVRPPVLNAQVFRARWLGLERRGRTVRHSSQFVPSQPRAVQCSRP